VVDGEVIWEESEGYYHHYPAMEQVWAWLGEAAVVIVEEAEGPGARRSTPTTRCWPVWRPLQAEDVHSAVAVGGSTTPRRAS
jgi:hypothetical protein